MMKMPFALAVCALALALLAPAPARMVDISVIRNLAMTVRQTAEIRVESHEAKAGVVEQATAQTDFT
ncbi:MAG: hypothetical protein WA629_08295 [Candidatus Aquilonibacter sp.]